MDLLKIVSAYPKLGQPEAEDGRLPDGVPNQKHAVQYVMCVRSYF